MKKKKVLFYKNEKVNCYVLILLIRGPDMLTVLGSKIVLGGLFVIINDWRVLEKYFADDNDLSNAIFRITILRFRCCFAL